MIEAGTVDLHQFAPAWGINPSPFCNKVETYFRLTGVTFRAVPSDPSTAPKGKLPYIVDQGRQIPDSGQIIAHLQAVRGDPLDGDLNAKQRALGHLLRRTCEESLYFALCYSRWIDEANWPIVRQAFFGGLPPAIEAQVATQTREGVARALQGQGYGRHSRRRFMPSVSPTSTRSPQRSAANHSSWRTRPHRSMRRSMQRWSVSRAPPSKARSRPGS
jgi:hypothetical protein